MTGDRESFVDGIRAISESVYSFHDRFGITAVDTSSRDEVLEAMKQRLVLLSEETGEHARAINRAEIDDAILEAVDIAYIALGTILRLGPAGVQACHEVARKNNAKTLANTRLSHAGKILRKDGKRGVQGL